MPAAHRPCRFIEPREYGRSSLDLLSLRSQLRACPTLKEPLESRPDPPLLSTSHARDKRPHEAQDAIRPEIPVPPHPRAVVGRFEVEPAREVHRPHLHALPDPARSLELGDPDRHGDDPLSPRHLGVERRANADRPLGGPSRPASVGCTGARSPGSPRSRRPRPRAARSGSRRPPRPSSSPHPNRLQAESRPTHRGHGATDRLSAGPRSATGRLAGPGYWAQRRNAAPAGRSIRRRGD